jgi:hypothetical protein
MRDDRWRTAVFSEGFQLQNYDISGSSQRMARNRVDLARLVEQTLWHEIAHHFGRNEQEIRLRID